MPLDDNRFVRARPPDAKSAKPSVVDVVSGKAASARPDSLSYGTTPRGRVKEIEMHEKEGMGQLTSALSTHTLLEEILEELRAIRIQLNNPKGPTSDLGRRMKHDDH